MLPIYSVYSLSSCCSVSSGGPGVCPFWRITVLLIPATEWMNEWTKARNDILAKFADLRNKWIWEMRKKMSRFRFPFSKSFVCTFCIYCPVYRFSPNHVNVHLFLPRWKFSTFNLSMHPECIWMYIMRYGLDLIFLSRSLGTFRNGLNVIYWIIFLQIMEMQTSSHCKVVHRCQSFLELSMEFCCSVPNQPHTFTYYNSMCESTW